MLEVVGCRPVATPALFFFLYLFFCKVIFVVVFIQGLGAGGRRNSLDKRGEMKKRGAENVFHHWTHERRTCTFLNNGVDNKQLFSNFQTKCCFLYRNDVMLSSL